MHKNRRGLIAHIFIEGYIQIYHHIRQNGTVNYGVNRVIAPIIMMSSIV